MTMPKKISVCIPAYNAASFLGKALESILEQQYENFEIVVVDNNSSDETESVVLSYNDDRIHFHRNATNIGYPANVNRALSLATGDYITIVCADDYLAGNTVLGDWMEAIEQNSNCVAVHSPYVHRELTERGGVEINSTISHSILDEGVCLSEAVLARFLQGNGFFGWAWCFSRAVLAEHKATFDPSINMAPDTLFWLNLVMMGPIFEMPRNKPAYVFVVRSDSLGGELFQDFWNGVVLELDKFEQKLFELIRVNCSDTFYRKMLARRRTYTGNESMCILKNNYIRSQLSWHKAMFLSVRTAVFVGINIFNFRFLANFSLVLLPRVVSIWLLKVGRHAN